MGLAASQAKLLSITSRLSDNELRSQSISAAKMALANKSSEASRKYMNSLNATEYTYRTYDDDGNKVFVPLTGRQLSEYGPLKNQYALVNTSGQVLLSERDAANYENSPTLKDFLEKYGIVLEPTGETQMVENPAYTDAYAQWQQDYDDWLAIKPNPEWAEFWKPSHLVDKFEDACSSCFDNAHILDGNGDPEKDTCYLHVLAHMIDLELEEPGIPNTSGGTYSHQASTTTGVYPKMVYTTPITFLSANNSPVGVEINGYDHITNSSICYSNKSDEMQEISIAISDGYDDGYHGLQTIYAAEDDYDNLGPTSDFLDVLLSNYVLDSSAPEGKRLKTLHQKCIDLFAAVSIYKMLELPSSVYITRLLPAIDSFHEDMCSLKDFDSAIYQQKMDEWYEIEPEISEPPTIEEPVYKYNDANKAQWYINLWYRANGPSDTNTSSSGYSKRLYDILEDGLMNSQQWLKYALETCTVSIERVIFAEEVPHDNGIKDAVWNSVIYTNVLELNEETNDKAIAIAEAEYERAQREIENKDKQYDSMLRLLDTEHTALQAEYDSVQKVIPKNLERTLKIYS